MLFFYVPAMKIFEEDDPVLIENRQKELSLKRNLYQ